MLKKRLGVIEEYIRNEILSILETETWKYSVSSVSSNAELAAAMSKKKG
jgi:hypothetical protein